MSRNCKDCGVEVVGRSDKLFCSDACRSNYHNRRLAAEKKKIYKVDRILKRNRRVLQELSLETIKLNDKEELSKRGFDFSYYTHSKKENGHSIYYCYDIGYKMREDGGLSFIVDQL